MSEDSKTPDSPTSHLSGRPTSLLRCRPYEPRTVPLSCGRRAELPSSRGAIEKPLTDDVSPDVAPTVQEFMAEAAEANREEHAEIAEEPVSAAEESAMRAADGSDATAVTEEEVGAVHRV